MGPGLHGSDNPKLRNLLKISILRMVQPPKTGAGSQTPAAANRRQPPEQLTIGMRQSRSLLIIHHSTFIIPSTASFNLIAFPTREPPEQTQVCIRGVFWGGAGRRASG